MFTLDQRRSARLILYCVRALLCGMFAPKKEACYNCAWRAGFQE